MTKNGAGNRLGLWEKLSAGKDYYEIRLESIGGLGANLCGKMLGELGLKYLDLNSSSFSSYGSEKTGTPVNGFIRYCNKEKEIRVHSPVVEPDLLSANCKPGNWEYSSTGATPALTNSLRSTAFSVPRH